MNKLLEKVVNCFNRYLVYLNCGKTDQNYDLLYGAVLSLKEKINDEQYIEYFYNNLPCPSTIKLEITDAMNRIIGVELSAESTPQPEFIWEEVDAQDLKTYTITTDSVSGYNFLYFSTPPDTNVIIYDALNNVLFNSTLVGDYEFELAGSIITSKGQTNTIYRKKNVYNSLNPVTFNISLF